MIHLDRPSETENLILPKDHKIVEWTDDHQSVQDNILLNVPDVDEPAKQLSGPSSPSPAITGPSPTLERSSSLSPVPDAGSPHTRSSPHPDPPDNPGAVTDVEDKPSRQSTPLSELSPSPDEGETEDLKDSENKSVGGEAVGANDTASSRPSDPSSKTVSDPSVNDEKSSSSPTRAASLETTNTAPDSPTENDNRGILILELNGELLKVCMEFQSRGIAIDDVRFRQYASRLQVNLSWLAGVAETNQKAPGGFPSMPSMDPPHPVDFMSMERIQAIYAQLPILFAKQIERRQAALASIPVSPTSILPSGLKRERTEELLLDSMNKRRDTGESKSAMLPPPIPQAHTSVSPPNSSMQFPMPNGVMSNGIAPSTPPMVDPMLSNPMNPAMGIERHTPVRPVQPQPPMPQRTPSNRQMSPPSSMGPGNMQNPVNGLGMSPPNIPQQPTPSQQLQQQLFAILNNPNHQFLQYMLKTVPGFATLPVQQQMQRMMMTQQAMQNRGQQQQQQQQQNMANSQMAQQANMGPMSNSLPINGGQFPNQSPMSPVNAQAQNMMMANGGDPRMNATPQAGPSGMQNNGMTFQQQQQQQQQRQLMLLQQQQNRSNIGAMNPAAMNPAMMNPQQQQMFLQQERMRQQQQQQGGSPHVASSMLPGNDNFPALRSNATIPGIARSTRSPPDNIPSPMTSRMPTRASSMGQEDYQRMMMQQQQQQQQQQQSRPMSSSGQGPSFGQQPMPGTNWGMQQPVQNQGFGMARPPSAGQVGGSYGGAPSPPNQNWSQRGSGTYPFSPSPNHQGDQRHMSGTPGPQMQSIDMNANEFDPFSWSQ
ncbi:hypothetical protein C8J56DRAFT_1134341 [Mycena floridula]|nr:hypothetical protein C8J56DRAFT_1134341 [Mycena floridula]